MTGVFVAWNPKRKDSPGWVEDGSGCHIWVGATIDGYGNAWSPRRRKIVRVHRIRWETEHGPVPEGMELDHFKCSNPSCCNPDHVRPVSHRENMLRGGGTASRHRAQTHCKRGHPLIGDNLELYALSRRGTRKCLVCRRFYGNRPRGGS